MNGSLHGTVCDLICVCETWLNADITDGLLLNGSSYDVVRYDRCDSIRGGGVCVFVKKGRSFTVVNPPKEFAHLELVCIDIICQYLKHRFICVI